MILLEHIIVPIYINSIDNNGNDLIERQGCTVIHDEAWGIKMILILLVQQNMIKNVMACCLELHMLHDNRSGNFSRQDFLLG